MREHAVVYLAVTLTFVLLFPPPFAFQDAFESDHEKGMVDYLAFVRLVDETEQ